MGVNIELLYDKHHYALAHGALPQQNKAFACLLANALHGNERLEIEIHADSKKASREAAKSALVAVYDTVTQRRVRAPLYQPLEIGAGAARPFSRLTVAMIAVEAKETIPLRIGHGSGGTMRLLSASELAKLDTDIMIASGGWIPNLFDTEVSRVSHAA